MKRPSLLLLVAMALGSCGGGSGGGGRVGSACVESDRSVANPVLCACIQSVADATLSSSDQRQVATFFEDPEEAQVIRASDTPSADAFWDRYLVFIESTRTTCE